MEDDTARPVVRLLDDERNVDIACRAHTFLIQSLCACVMTKQPLGLRCEEAHPGRWHIPHIVESVGVRAVELVERKNMHLAGAVADESSFTHATERRDLV